MHRNARRTRVARIFACLAILLGIPSTAAALPLISELFYDAVGSDDGLGFVEIFGTPGTDLSGLTIEGINGSNGAVTHSIALSGVIPADGLFVLADSFSGGGTAVPDADLLAAFDFQNGPDSVVLRDPVEDRVLDAIGYGVFDGGDVFAGEGAPAPDPAAGASLARHFADLDSDDNFADFGVRMEPTPGVAPVSVPEPSTGVLAGAALVGLAVCSRRRGARPGA